MGRRSPYEGAVVRNKKQEPIPQNLQEYVQDGLLLFRIVT